MQNDKLKFKDEFKRRIYKFALEIIKLVDELPKEKTCEIIGNQLLRSATSVGANVVEANSACSKKDYINFFNYALKSANESKFWLGLLRDSGKFDKDKTNKLLKETTEIANILASSILTLKGRK
ncbi:MAG: four helix bundle protein [Actinobacteria bacterium]|nr:four helix bundle protein [Actinomycetota bacterium]